MPYVGSYVWKLRQKVGHDLLVLPAVDITAIRDDGKILMVFNKDFDAWAFPGGLCEDGDASWTSCALTELLEEGGVTAEKSDLVPFAAVSGVGWKFYYPNGDSTQCYSMHFVVKKWRISSDILDDSEISERGFFSIDEIKELNICKSAQIVFSAYEKYLETGELQMVEVAS